MAAVAPGIVEAAEVALVAIELQIEAEKPVLDLDKAVGEGTPLVHPD